MAVSPCNVETDQRRQERAVHGTAQFPAACYDDDLTETPVPWHWHRELEAAVVTEGAVLVTAGARQFTLTRGQGFFLNAEVLHTVRNGGAGPCGLHSVVFHPRLVGGSMDSVFWQKYLLPVQEDRSLDGLPLDGSAPWHRAATAAVEAAFSACAGEPEDYEFRVREALSRLICLVRRDLRPEAGPVPERLRLREIRVKQMLEFIHGHYAEELRVEQVAACASVSVSECLRCFRAVIGMTPVQYLRQYRVERAALLLRTSDRKIAEIGASCGFQETSYFARTFQTLMGRSPSQYRREQAGPDV